MTDSSDRPSKPGKKKIRVDLRRNRRKSNRDRTEWTRLYESGADKAHETASSENVRAKGDLSRKRTVVVPDQPAGQGGVVVAMRGQLCEVDDGSRIWACTVRRLLRTRLITERHPIVVGDRVQFEAVEVGGEEARAVRVEQDLPEGVIEDVAPPQPTLLRQYEPRVHLIAANVDTIVIVVAADQPTLRPHLIDRYLVAVHKGDMRPVICINKADLDVDGFAGEVRDRYAALGYRAILACVPRGEGVDALREELRDRTSSVIGPSGVGKSSLINAIDPRFNLAVGTLTDLARGKHTTTTARLLRWAFGGYIVDTPGIRQFELAEVRSDELEAYFKEFVDRVSGCRFQNCTHTHEVGCAIKTAVESGEITPERYDSYCKMFEECREKERF